MSIPRIYSYQAVEWYSHVSPEEMAAKEGFVSLPLIDPASPQATAPELHTHPSKVAQLEWIWRVRSEIANRAALGLPHLGTMLSLRPDLLIAPEDGLPIGAGFRWEWMLVATHFSLSETLAEWSAAGWQVDGGPYPSVQTLLVPEVYQQAATYARVLKGGEPVFYWHILDTPAKPKILKPRGIRLDWRIPECRAWLVERAVAMVKAYGVDAIVVGLKTGWYAHPLSHRVTPEGFMRRESLNAPWTVQYPLGQINDPCVISDGSTVADGEWQAATAALMRGYVDAGLAVMTSERPPTFGPGGAPPWWPDGGWSWADADLASRLLGETDPVPGPSSS